MNRICFIELKKWSSICRATAQPRHHPLLFKRVKKKKRRVLFQATVLKWLRTFPALQNVPHSHLNFKEGAWARYAKSYKPLFSSAAASMQSVGTCRSCAHNNRPFWLLFIRNHKAASTSPFSKGAWLLLCWVRTLATWTVCKPVSIPTCPVSEPWSISAAWRSEWRQMGGWENGRVERRLLFRNVYMLLCGLETSPAKLHHTAVYSIGGLSFCLQSTFTVIFSHSDSAWWKSGTEVLENAKGSFAVQNGDGVISSAWGVTMIKPTEGLGKVHVFFGHEACWRGLASFSRLLHSKKGPDGFDLWSVVDHWSDLGLPNNQDNGTDPWIRVKVTATRCQSRESLMDLQLQHRYKHH